MQRQSVPNVFEVEVLSKGVGDQTILLFVKSDILFRFPSGQNAAISRIVDRFCLWIGVFGLFELHALEYQPETMLILSRCGHQLQDSSNSFYVLSVVEIFCMYLRLSQDVVECSSQNLVYVKVIFNHVWIIIVNQNSPRTYDYISVLYEDSLYSD
ncbi:Hypothetical_protein [Hexamita inflata]|uniref:Hypothetical_protein n=1 Tax=Hexamita inflata TaxID=28002 RepID=A0AA86NP39_9EUKA|nr:Hypothetical protein HINF_LOCUS10794 [Hexamita inflata]